MPDRAHFMTGLPDTWVQIPSNSVELEEERAIHESQLGFSPADI